MSKFLIDIEKIRKDARIHIAKGPITENYKLDLEEIYKILNSALATEIICQLRYKKHHYKAASLGAKVAADEFLEHSEQEGTHADQLAQRIVQLGGEPDFSPETLLQRTHADYVDCDTVAEMIKENLIAERIAIDIYREIINYIGDADPTTSSLIEDILATEEEHADDLLDLAAEYNTKFE